MPRPNDSYKVAQTRVSEQVHSTEMLQYKLTYVVASAIFWLPIFSVICYWLGDVKDASPANVRNIMQRGKNIALLPGGFEDASVMVNGRERIFLRSRKGFIKFALRYGYRVHPVGCLPTDVRIRAIGSTSGVYLR